MKFTSLTNLRKSATLSAAAAAGYAAGLASGPGDVGIQDEVQMELRTGSPPVVATVNDDVGMALNGAAADPVPAATASPTPPEPVAGCAREILVPRAATDLVGFLGDPASGYVLVQEGHQPLPLPPGAVDARLAALEGRYHKAGTQDLYANVELALYDPSGAMKDFRALPNLIVNAGRALGIKMLIGDNTGSCPSVPCGNSGTCANPAKFNWVAIGASGTSENASQTGLVSEFTIGADYSRQQDTAPDYPGTAGQGKLIVTFGADNPNNGGTILETGVLNAQTGGTMLARRTVGSITKGDLDVLQVTWTFTLS